MSCGVETEANALLSSLTEGMDFTIPVIDLNDDKFKFPGGLDSEIYKTLSRLSNESLTTRTVGGAGTFDALMAGIDAQLASQFNKGRITGAAYAEVYTQLTQSAMTTAASYLLGREQTFWQSINAQIAAIQAMVEIEKAKVQVYAIQMEARNQQANYGLTKVQIAGESMKYCLSKYELEFTAPAQLGMLLKQTEGQEIENDLNLARLNDLMPVEIATAEKKMELMGIELQTSTYNLTYMMPQQVELLHAQFITQQAEASIKEFERSNMLPVKQSALTAEKDGKEIENEMLRFRRDYYQPQELSSLTYDTQSKAYTLNSILPQDARIKTATADGLLIKSQIDNFTLNQLMPKEDIIKYHENLLKQAQVYQAEAARDTALYTLSQILPAQAQLLREQYETARAATTDHRSDGTLISGGTLGTQKALNRQQIDSYRADAKIKGAKIFTDAWSVQKTIDEGLAPPNGFVNSSIDVVLANLRSELGLD